jgi:RNA polymerase sigma-70 factor (ECF subfamily)
MGSISEEEFVKRVRSGDRDAWRRLVEERYPRIYRFLRGATGRDDAAESLTRQTFLRAREDLRSFRGDSSLSARLHRIAHRELADWRRASPEEPPPDLENGLPPEAALLQRALRRMEPEQREAFLLHDVQGLTAREGGYATETPERAFQSRLSTARRQLRDLLDGSQEMYDYAFHFTAAQPEREAGADGSSAEDDSRAAAGENG